MLKLQAEFSVGKDSTTKDPQTMWAIAPSPGSHSHTHICHSTSFCALLIRFFLFLFCESF